MYIPSKPRSLALAACLAAALLAQAALAGCPPGYRVKAGHCIPGPAPTHHPRATSIVHSPSAITPVHHQPRALPPEMIDKSKVKPQPGAPIEQHASASDPRRVIFVGGKSAINSRKAPPGKAALNPQPIPPGHAVHKPRPGAPIEQPIGH